MFKPGQFRVDVIGWTRQVLAECLLLATSDLLRHLLHAPTLSREPAMSTRSRATRRQPSVASSAPALATAPAPVDLGELTNVERLLIAQAVHQLGANAWTNVSKLLSNHPLVDRPKPFFSPQVSSPPDSSFSHIVYSVCYHVSS